MVLVALVCSAARVGCFGLPSQVIKLLDSSRCCLVRQPLAKLAQHAELGFSQIAGQLSLLYGADAKGGAHQH